MREPNPDAGRGAAVRQGAEVAVAADVARARAWDIATLRAAVAEAVGVDPASHNAQCDAGARLLYSEISIARMFGTQTEQEVRRRAQLHSYPEAVIREALLSARSLERLVALLAPGTPARQGLEAGLVDRVCDEEGDFYDGALQDEACRLVKAIEQGMMVATTIAAVLDCRPRPSRGRLRFTADGTPLHSPPEPGGWSAQDREMLEALGILPGGRRGPRLDIAADWLFYGTARLYHELTGRRPAGITHDATLGGTGAAGPLWQLCQRVWAVCWPGPKGPSERRAKSAALRFAADHARGPVCPSCKG